MKYILHPLVYGKWGVGKSSIINLMKEYFDGQSKRKRPLVIDFNPWRFSESDNINDRFFNEISKSLLKSDIEQKRATAKKLKLYSKALELIPEKKVFFGISPILLSIVGLFMPIISASFIESSLQKTILICIGIFFTVPGIVRAYLTLISEWYEYQANGATVSELKEQIGVELRKKDKKLLIIIDDIDRLNPKEMKQIFTLVRMNADFPNTIYLLAFDRNIVEKSLESIFIDSARSFLEKIVQVGFDVPYVKQSKIEGYLFTQLDRILAKLPESAEELFDKTEWGNIFHSGYKNLFQSLRDAKRYISSLEFNISLMYYNGVMEVNPVDFIAVEAIRVFAPEYYSRMKSERSLFTETHLGHILDYTEREARDTRRSQKIDEMIKFVKEEDRENVRELTNRLFPQLKERHGNEWQAIWRRKLKVCAEACYDAYFTLIPGGSDDEISNYDMDVFFEAIDDSAEINRVLSNYIKNKKIRQMLYRIQDYTEDIQKIKMESETNLITALFNISDELTNERQGMFDFGARIDILRIVHQLIMRHKNKEERYNLLNGAISAATSIYGPVNQVLSYERGDDERHKSLSTNLTGTCD